MKKQYSLALLLVATLLGSTRTFAQIDNLVNCSPEWIRSGTRNAATDAADIMVYNPGGVSRLSEGWHLNIGNQSFFRDPQHSYTADYGMGPTNFNYHQVGSDMVVPNIYISYNKNNWAIFGGGYIAGGGATANFPNGSISTDMVAAQTIGYVDAADDYSYTNGKNAYLKASSAYYASLLGGSYKLNDMISFGLAGRLIVAQNTTQAGVTLTDATGAMPDYPMTLDANYNALGFGGMAGIDIKPTDKLNLAIRYESQTNLNFKTQTVHDDFGITTNGQMNRRDLPGVLGLGMSYTFSDKFKMMADFNYYFQTSADWGTSDVAGVTMPTSQLAGNASTYAISGEYKICKQVSFSLGGVYSLFSYKNEAGYYTNMGAYETLPENNFSVCTGFGINVTDKIKLNAGFVHSFYGKNNTVQALNLLPQVVNVTVNNSISGVAIGADFAF